MFADRLKFTTMLSAGAGPKLTMSAVPGRFRATSVKADLDARRIDMHQVTIAAAARLRSAPGVRVLSPTTNSLLSTSIIQTQVGPEQRALLELDRQRLLTLQDRVTNQIVGP